MRMHIWLLNSRTVVIFFVDIVDDEDSLRVMDNIIWQSDRSCGQARQCSDMTNVHGTA